MGEASRKKLRRRETLLAAQPRCIYCGGANEATTVDHMPPRIIFDSRHRPQRLEFPACEPCNAGGKKAEQVAGLFSRLYPNPPNEETQREMQRLVREVANNHPGLLAEMRPTLRQRLAFAENRDRFHPNAAGPINATGPRLRAAMNTFAAKLTLALHYNATGNILPASGAILARWFPNYAVAIGAVPEDLLRLVGEPQTLHNPPRHSVELAAGQPLELVNQQPMMKRGLVPRKPAPFSEASTDLTAAVERRSCLHPP